MILISFCVAAPVEGKELINALEAMEKCDIVLCREPKQAPNLLRWLASEVANCVIKSGHDLDETYDWYRKSGRPMCISSFLSQ